MRQPGEVEERGTGGLPPVRVFLGLMAVLVVAGAAVFLNRNDPPPEPVPTVRPSPDFSLTDAEAIARFKELRQLRDRMYRDRDLSFAPLVYTPDSDLIKIVAKELRKLIRNDIDDRSVYKTKAVSVLTNSGGEIRLREQVLIRPRFINGHGEDVSRQRRPVRQTVVWTLHEIHGTWLIHDSVITGSRILQ